MKQAIRIKKLNSTIKKIFGQISVDDLGLVENNYDRLTTEMIEITYVRGQRCRASHMFEEDIQFDPLILPPKIFALIKPNDVFLAVMGLKQGRWHVIYLSPAYSSGTVCY